MRNNNLLGIAALCAGSLVFSLQDSAIKAISGEHAVTLAIVLRSLVSFPIIVAMVAARLNLAVRIHNLFLSLPGFAIG
jgi:hypothetical protein